MKNQNVRLAISFVVGVIVGVAGYALVNHNNSAIPVTDPSLASQTDISTSTAMAAVSGSSVSVSDQSAGNSVSLSNIVLAHDGWVAIHDDVNGVPGRILGAKLFPAGTTATGSVALLRNTVAGTSYFAVIHASDGDIVFTPKTDKILYDAQNNVVMTKFTAQ